MEGKVGYKLPCESSYKILIYVVLYERREG